tara:strand:+ start:33218 stop:36574 length:3357 start_codon:yes stop_codon:yes gene_type:complete
MSQKLENQIIALLEHEPKQVARTLAEKLNVDKKQINAVLYGSLKGRVEQDKKYRWSLVSKNTSLKPKSTEKESANTDLAKLCLYYLSCMGQGDIGISTFAQNKYGVPDYSELKVLPKNSQELIENDDFQEVLGRVRSDRSPKALYLGYPTSLKLIKSKRSSWEGYMVEPILLFPIEIGTNSKSPQLDISYPIINRTALQSYTNAEREALMEELVQLEDELGIGGENNSAELDEIALRLQSVRSEWPWQEDINPDQLNTAEPNIADINSEGIFNRAVVIMAEASPFTQGLESELRDLARKPEEATVNTALGHWLAGGQQENLDQNDETQELIEVLPMNLEQHNAVSSALTKPLTIITGPPGTGKSQVVTNLLINAAWQGKRVLFASKNNKAVDVVEARVNNLGNRPILLRVGSSAYQTSLAEYLMAFLSTTATDDEKLEFEEASNIHTKLLKQIDTLDAETEKLIKARNLTDKLEQDIEIYRSELPGKLIQSLKSLDLTPITLSLDSFKQSMKKADKNQQQLLISLLWPLFERSRLASATQKVDDVIKSAKQLGLENTDDFVGSMNISMWMSFVEKLEARLSVSESIRKYFSALKDLQESKPLEQISKERISVMGKIATNSEALWKLWLKVQPSKLSVTDRNMINRYNSTLKMVIENGPGAQLSKSIYREYRSLFSKVSHLLPCWAVTSLSAKGKIPFEPGVFDLVVFDEASQCDIASALPLLYRAKAAVVIGDPNQLSHISGLQKGQDQQLLDKYDLVSDYLHWAYSYNSLFDLASGMVSNDSVINLLDHHRSHADVIEFSNKEFYGGRLRVATRYNHLKPVSANEPGVRWVDVQGSVRRPANGGAVNSGEVSAVVNTLEELILERGYKGSVGVVSPFRAQANAIRVAVEANSDLSRALQTRGFLSDTVHKFQGDERDVMVFSPVFSKGMTPGGVGFLRNNGNLFNVAITRARAQLIVVGDLTSCSKCEVSYLSNFAKYTQLLQLQEHNDISKNMEEDLGVEYPETSNPEQVSDWERMFYSALYDAGIKTLPQYRVEKYALDLAIVDGDRLLDIEVDGEKYHRNWTGELCRRDQIRNHRLYELGWDVMRFWVYEIRDDMPGCIQKVKDWKNKKNKSKS